MAKNHIKIRISVHHTCKAHIKYIFKVLVASLWGIYKLLESFDLAFMLLELLGLVFGGDSYLLFEFGGIC